MSTHLLEPTAGTGSFAGEPREMVTHRDSKVSSTDLHLPLSSSGASLSIRFAFWSVESGASDPSQAWFWTPEWQAGEAEADAQMTAGLGEFYESGEDLAQAFRERRSRNGNI